MRQLLPLEARESSLSRPAAWLSTAYGSGGGGAPQPNPCADRPAAHPIALSRRPRAASVANRERQAFAARPEPSPAMFRLALLLCAALAVSAAEYKDRKAYAAANDVVLEPTLVEAKLPAACKASSGIYMENTGARGFGRSAAARAVPPPRRKPQVPARRSRSHAPLQTCSAATSSPPSRSRWTLTWEAAVSGAPGAPARAELGVEAGTARPPPRSAAVPGNHPATTGPAAACDAALHLRVTHPLPPPPSCRRVPGHRGGGLHARGLLHHVPPAPRCARCRRRAPSAGATGPSGAAAGCRPAPAAPARTQPLTPSHPRAPAQADCSAFTFASPEDCSSEETPWLKARAAGGRAGGRALHARGACMGGAGGGAAGTAAAAECPPLTRAPPPRAPAPPAPTERARLLLPQGKRGGGQRCCGAAGCPPARPACPVTRPAMRRRRWDGRLAAARVQPAARPIARDPPAAAPALSLRSGPWATRSGPARA